VLSSYQNILLLLTGVLASLSQSRSTYWQIACISLFAWLISHQPTIFFSQNKPATSNHQPASSTFLSEQTSTSHQPPAKRPGFIFDTFFACILHSLKPFLSSEDEGSVNPATAVTEFFFCFSINLIYYISR
jgi:hypothetical protein